MTSLSILLVDDDKNIRQTLVATLKAWGHEVIPAGSVDEATRFLKSRFFDVMLTDFKLDSKTGLDLIRTGRSLMRPPISIVMTAYASFENAVVAVKEGAFDYIPKPFSNAQLEHLLSRVAIMVELKRENESLRKTGARLDFFEAQSSPAMARLEEFVRKIATTEASVLLGGESGTGKTELAKLIHQLSPRSAKAFGVVNCATLTETLLESELFGHVKGAFTGASHDHVGKLESANRGTVFIDEIGELSLAGQAKLLRFLQDKVIERVGGNIPLLLDVRVIAATNHNLQQAVEDGKFREDLYYRLNVFECTLVPLRFRKEDLPHLIQRFYREGVATQHEYEAKPIPDLVLKLMLEYSWPGNIRELRNVLERVILLAKGRQIQVTDLPDSVREGSQRRLPGGVGEPIQSLEDLERNQIERVLRLESNQEKAAELLGITTVTLWRKRKQYGLP